MDKLEIVPGAYVLIRPREEWTFTDGVVYINGEKFERNIDGEDLDDSEMAKLFGKAIKVKRIVSTLDDFCDTTIFHSEEGEFVWDSTAVVRIVTEEDDPEHFI